MKIDWEFVLIGVLSALVVLGIWVLGVFGIGVFPNEEPLALVGVWVMFLAFFWALFMSVQK